MTQSFKKFISMDTIIEEKGDGILDSFLHHENISALQQVTSSNLSQIIDVILSNLTQREREIVKLRFGIGEKHDHTLEKIGERFNLSRERIRQILEVALRKLKKTQNMMKLREFMEAN